VLVELAQSLASIRRLDRGHSLTLDHGAHKVTQIIVVLDDEDLAISHT